MKRIFHALLCLTLVAAALATGVTLPADAGPQTVLVRLVDGSTREVVVDAPTGSTPDSVQDQVEGDPISIQPVADQGPVPAPQPEPAPAPAPQPAPRSRPGAAGCYAAGPPGRQARAPEVGAPVAPSTSPEVGPTRQA